MVLKPTVRKRKPLLSKQVTPVKGRKPASAALRRRTKFVYRNEKYKFSLTLPDWWKPYIVIKTAANPDSESIYDVMFLFKYKGKTYGDVLTLSVFRMPLAKWIEEGYDESPYIRLAHRKGLIFAYSTPEEPPAEFLNESGDDFNYEQYGEQLKLMSRMVNEDAPEIAKTFKLI
ncbi:hypothetical protein [Paenibacillus sp. NFR01]|uniref:hypothetical protein n=1 Tax=Paenibacillus sp. NFR01 TaxID=1566279 RepID=UPI0008AAA081|nr:hypothetical protein [Paenibacillus sp. NFR01]SET20360.1 hypothetical protein SAMN03159358_1005 [Paenibacillus sp. NFR01]